jgi:hypothetical protein
MSGNLYISPPGSEGGLPDPVPQNVKPTLNKTLMKKRVYRRPVFLHGTFRKNNRNTLESREWGNTPFFTNAKPTSMLERGWIRSRSSLKYGQKGLYTVKDGPEVEVTVVSRGQVYNGNRKNSKLYYVFLDTSGNNIHASEGDRYEEWDFYTATRPVPFVRRRGGTRKHKKRKTMRRKAYSG